MAMGHNTAEKDCVNPVTASNLVFQALYTQRMGAVVRRLEERCVAIKSLDLAVAFTGIAARMRDIAVLDFAVSFNLLSRG